MARIHRCEIFQVNLPLRRPFRHAAKERLFSESVFLRLTTDRGTQGWGEGLPRNYVTGETAGGVHELLKTQVLPRLMELSFSGYDEVVSFLKASDGKAPRAWVEPEKPQAVAWAAVDLALLDTLSREFHSPVWPRREPRGGGDDFRYSAVLSSGSKFDLIIAALKLRFYGFEYVKLKVGPKNGTDQVRTLRRWMGHGAKIRVDENMAWSREKAAEEGRALSRFGVRWFEQPLAAGDLEGLSWLLQSLGPVLFVEGCYGLRLLGEDPGDPMLEFGYGGRPPQIPPGFGFGVRVREDILRKYTVRYDSVERSLALR